MIITAPHGRGPVPPRNAADRSTMATVSWNAPHLLTAPADVDAALVDLVTHYESIMLGTDGAIAVHRHVFVRKIDALLDRRLELAAAHG